LLSLESYLCLQFWRGFARWCVVAGISASSLGLTRNYDEPIKIKIMWTATTHRILSEQTMTTREVTSHALLTIREPSWVMWLITLISRDVWMTARVMMLCISHNHMLIQRGRWARSHRLPTQACDNLFQWNLFFISLKIRRMYIYNNLQTYLLSNHKSYISINFTINSPP
jgi:intracellular septation protein A